MVALTWYSLSYIPYGRQLFQRFILPVLKPVIKVVRASFLAICEGGAFVPGWGVTFIRRRPRSASWREYASSFTLMSPCCVQPSYTCF